MRRIVRASPCPALIGLVLVLGAGPARAQDIARTEGPPAAQPSDAVILMTQHPARATLHNALMRELGPRGLRVRLIEAPPEGGSYLIRAARAQQEAWRQGAVATVWLEAGRVAVVKADDDGPRTAQLPPERSIAWGRVTAVLVGHLLRDVLPVVTPRPRS